MRILTVTSSGDDGSGLTLREAVAQAGKTETVIRFADDVRGVTLAREIDIGSRANITIDGDKDGDGVCDVYIDSEEHHFTVAAGANLTLSDLFLFGGKGDGARGADGESKASVTGYAGDGLDGQTVELDLNGFDLSSREGKKAANAAAEALSAGELQALVLDATNGEDGDDGEDGGVGENGESVAGSIDNSGNLTLIRVGFGNNLAVGGDGGYGGQGGRGWNGGNGGEGSVGAVTLTYGGGSPEYWVDPNVRDGGAGGDGGKGGDGGDGGAGGRGGDAAAAVLNHETGRVKMVDVSLGGRAAFGTMTDRFGETSLAGDGGNGGWGGAGGQAGIAGDGAQDMATVSPGDAIATGEFYSLFAPDGTELYREAEVFYGVHRPSYFLIEGSYIVDEPMVGRAYNTPTTLAGVGGDGGDGGTGGDAGANGGGGHAAPIVNYGTILGNVAGGAAGKSHSGLGWTGLDPERGLGGDGGTATTGRAGGYESIEFEFRLEPPVYKTDPMTEYIDGWEIRGLPSGETWTTKPALDDRFLPQDSAADGLDGAVGEDGKNGKLGKNGEEREVFYSEGVAAGLDTSKGFVYLAGVRQSDDFGKLLFTLVRVGDTSKAVSVTYKIGGAGRDGVGNGDFGKPAQLEQTIVFDAIDSALVAYDADGKGVAHIEIDLKADGIHEGAEGFRIDLASKDVGLGTSKFVGTVWDADFRSVKGTEGNDRRLNGSKKDDVIDALDGNDRLNGKAGSDVLLGGSGKDIVNGGNGADILNGGAGGDRFVFAGRKAGADLIEDFGKGDVIDLTGYAGLRFRDLDIAKTDEGALVSWKGGSVLLEGIGKAQVDAGDFDFA